jgi:hypothetical protein
MRRELNMKDLQNLKIEVLSPEERTLVISVLNHQTDSGPCATQENLKHFIHKFVVRILKSALKQKRFSKEGETLAISALKKLAKA